VLAALSYYDWLAGERRLPLRQMWRAAWGWKASLAGGVLLAASGFLLMEGTNWWERGLWLLILAGAAVGLWRMRGSTDS
jgi:hypothetical protein